MSENKEAAIADKKERKALENAKRSSATTRVNERLDRIDRYL